MALRTIDYRIKGKVQGVYFRAFVRSTAQELGIVGWVKNEPVSFRNSMKFLAILAQHKCVHYRMEMS